ncbi:Rossmann-like and DUF2520 domain-containing protein [Nonlabens marinus]|uniref:DUF2520 domain-containing protein n=1 Tax=Nonlabens marinus S1-08 TaxID=1454201 RepID=W8VRI4_9FLAO|nr:Rossmann-like and DUF2520 domain-containing protein [Nonlabens marinus]BAO56274.1 hypothetical protein NMS_2265 [Nonlabens marinus S1-08]
MIKVFFIGTGNLGTQLCQAMEKSHSDNVQVVGYSNDSNRKINDIKAPLFVGSIPLCDLVVLAVPDDKIQLVSDGLSKSQATVVHTSGSVDVNLLSRFDDYGVFYIPQTFSKGRSIDLSEVTFCLEASNDSTMEQLELVASTLSRKRKKVNSAQRRQLHLAAVYMNNFVNHCYHKAAELLEQSAMDTDLLEPLMIETLKKAQELGPKNAQTGPAMRGDQNTINKHIALLIDSDREMYRAITHSIKNSHGKKL